MAIAKENIELIKAHIGDRLTEQNLGKLPAVCEIELRECINSFMRYSFGITIGIGGVIIGMFKFWPQQMLHCHHPCFKPH